MARINVELLEDVHRGLKIFAMNEHLTIPEAVNALLNFALEEKHVVSGVR